MNTTNEILAIWNKLYTVTDMLEKLVKRLNKILPENIANQEDIDNSVNFGIVETIKKFPEISMTIKDKK